MPAPTPAFRAILSGPALPPNALIDDAGLPLVDDDGAYLLDA